MVNPNENPNNPMYGEVEFAARLLITYLCSSNAPRKIIVNSVSDMIKGTPFRKRQVRIKEHSRPRVICPTVHVILELNELVNATYPHLISGNVANEQERNEEERHPKK